MTLRRAARLRADLFRVERRDGAEGRVRGVRLPERGEETMSPRWPWPIGVIKSSTRVESLSAPFSSLIQRFGLMVVSSSKGSWSRYKSMARSFTCCSSTNCGPRPLEMLRPESCTPSRNALRLIISGGTKTSCGVGALPRSGLRKKP